MDKWVTGSLSKGFRKGLPQKIPQLDDLQQQINKLKDLLTSFVLLESQPEEESTLQEILQLDDLQQQINELEDIISKKLDPSSDNLTTKQFSQVKELEKEIKKSKSIDIERKIIKILQKQNKKLDALEKKLQSFSNWRNEKIIKSFLNL